MPAVKADGEVPAVKPPEAGGGDADGDAEAALYEELCGEGQDVSGSKNATLHRANGNRSQAI